MAQITISDEGLVAQLEAVAALENRPVEDVLRAALAVYTTAPVSQSSVEATNDAIQAYRRNLYAQARRYWETTSDSERLALTDEMLDSEFWLIDGEGVPRLKADAGNFEHVPNSLLSILNIVQTMGIDFEHHFDAANADDVLNTEFADYLLKRMQNGAEASSD